MTSDVPAAADGLHREIGQWGWEGGVQLALSGQSLKRNACRGDGFLDCIFPLFQRQASELNSGVSGNSWQNGQESTLPTYRRLNSSTHGTAPFG
jgi:hypothetical protein